MVEAAKRWESAGILVNALNPGRITDTGLTRHIGGVGKAPGTFESSSTDVSWKDSKQGAATSVLLAASPLIDGVSGRYFEDANEAGPHQEGVRRGVANYALDAMSAERLWKLSESLIENAK